MKNYLRALLLVGLVCLITGVAMAQDEPPLIIESVPPFYLPSLEMNLCTDDTEATEICDMVATTLEDIAGTWRVYFQAEPKFIRFNADGTWLIADTVEHTEAESAEGFPFGAYSFDADGAFNHTDLSPGSFPDQCASNSRYLIRVIKMGAEPVALNFVPLDDCFAPRRTDWAYTMLRVSE
jgi:hypothetical protein